jgi:hypothetical protein
MEYKNLIYQFNKKFLDANYLNITGDEIEDEELLVKMKINNMNYLSRSSIIPKDKLLQRFQDEFPNYSKEKLSSINNIFEGIYDLRLNKEILIKNYQNEFKEFQKNSLNLIEEAISSEIRDANENIKRQEFVKFYLKK